MKRDVLSLLKAKKAAVRFGHPSRQLRLVVVSGSGASTTAVVLAEIFREAGKKTAVFAPRGSRIEAVPYTPSYSNSAEETQRAVAAARKQRCEIAIIVFDQAMESSGVIKTLSVDLLLITDHATSSDALSNQPTRYLVMPSGQDSDYGAVAPHHAITFGEDQLADARIEKIKLYNKGTEINLVIDHQTTVELATFLVGYSNATRVSAAVAAAYVMGVSIDNLPEGVARTESVIGNFQRVDVETPYRVIIDDASSEKTLTDLVRSAKQLAKRRVLLVCDQSVEPGALSVVKPEVDRLIVVKGHNGMATDQADSLTEAVSLVMRGAKLNDTVLLAGEELSEQVDEEQTRGARLVRGGSE